MLAQLSLWMFLAMRVLYPSAAPSLADPRALLPTAHPPLFSQRPQDASPPCLNGIINAYTPVLGFGCDSSTLQVGSLIGFNPGDKVLLLQMQVTQVDLSNTAGFGSLLNTTCIGNYEFNRIQTLSGGTIQLQYALTRPYDVSGKVQLVRVPEYDSATVCNLTCLPWNGTVGGVVALDVKNQLTLSGNVDVSGKGFRGGVVENNIIPWVFGEMQYYYPPVSTLAAAKGEGIVVIPVEQSYGRGRAGNGGGGGNAHNAGGGGGGNAGAGGSGGYEILNLPGAPTPLSNGVGGQKYFDNQVNKILLGGGAGAGHANDALGSAGGAGGGIAFLLAGTLKTNGFRILANGADVFGGVEHNDGQGGGGGGGSIVLKIGQINGLLGCEGKGGRGGSNPYTPDFQLHGPGGGGGGGKLLLTQNSPNVVPALQGGINGLTSQNFTHGAFPGEAGKVLSGFVLPEDHLPAHPVSDHLSLAVQSPLCAGSTTGQIAVLQSTALTFRLNGGPWQTDSIFTNLAPGTYTIGLRFSGGCTLDTLATLIAPPPVRDSLLAITTATCSAGGSISVTAVSGTPPFQFQLNGGSWQPGGLFDNLSPGNYTLLLRDAGGCTHATPYTVPAAPPVADSVLTISDATCTGGGTISVAAVAGTPPFQFQLDGGNWQAGGIFTGLPPGNYAITVRDAAGCTASGNYPVAAPLPVLDSLLNRTDATCLTGGSLDVTALSGTAPFEFQLNGGNWQPTGVFTGLPPGNYTLTARDAAGCTHAGDYAVAPPPPVADSLLKTANATCLTGGSLEVAALSGTAPFEFQLNGGNWQPTGLFTGLSPGNYAITVRDAAGCTHTGDYPVAAPPPVLDSLLNRTNATCLTGGSLDVAVLSGTAPFEFQLNGGNWQPGGVFTGLPAGQYALTLRDAAGCTHTANYGIGAPPPVLDSLLSLANATCISGGTIQVGALSGTAPFEFQLDGGSWQPDGVFTGLPPGQYAISLRDGAGCVHTGNYAVASPPPVSDTLVQRIAATCVSGGTLQVEGVAGTPPFEFQLNGGNWQPAGVFTGLAPGLHTIALRDAAGCLYADDYTVDAPPPVLDSLLAIVTATCTSGGGISITAVSGTAPFEFQLDGGSWQAVGNFTGLTAGSHSITTRDGAGCVHSSDYVIPTLSTVRDSLLTLTAATCISGGAVQVTAVAGTAPFEFRLAGGNWQADGVFTGLPPGTYTVAVRDAVGCTDSGDYTVAAPPPVVDSLLQTTAATCTQGGSLSVAALSGTAPFEFQSGSGAWQPTGVFNDLPAGTYVVVVRDAAGCTHSGLYAIAPPLPVQDSLLALSNATCFSGGGISVVATSGLPPFTFQLGNGPWQPTGSFNGLAPGTYVLTLRDAAGCMHIGNYTVDAPPPVQDSLLNITRATCLTGGSISLTAVSGTGPFTFQLAGGMTQSNGVFTGLPAGVYSITLRDAAGCSHTGVYTVPAVGLPSLALDSVRAVDCRHASGALAVSATGGTAPYTYRLQPGQQVAQHGYFPDLEAGLYAVTVTDSLGCQAHLDHLSVADLTDTVLTRETITIYEGSYYERPDGQRLVRGGEYLFPFVSREGCDSLHVVELIVLQRHVYVPNVFSPGGDGSNDYFTVFSDASLAVVRRLQVFDRWGELVFEKRDLLPNQPENGWNGTFRGRPMAGGVFVWLAELEFVDGLKRTIWGDLTVVR